MKFSSVSLTSAVAGGIAAAAPFAAARLQASHGKKKTLRTYRRVSSLSSPHERASGTHNSRRQTTRELRNLEEGDDLLASPDDDEIASGPESFENCDLAPPDSDAPDVGLLGSLWRGGCSSEADICILPNVIGFDVHSPFEDYGDDEDDDSPSASIEDSSSDGYYSEDYDPTAMGICYPVAELHESYWKSFTVQDEASEEEAEEEEASEEEAEGGGGEEEAIRRRRLRTLQGLTDTEQHDLSMDALTQQDVQNMDCERLCGGLERPDVGAWLRSQIQRRRLEGFVVEKQPGRPEQTVTSNSVTVTEDELEELEEDSEDDLGTNETTTTTASQSGSVGIAINVEGGGGDDFGIDHIDALTEEAIAALLEEEREIYRVQFRDLTAKCQLSRTMIYDMGFSTYPSQCPFDLSIPMTCWDMSSVTDLGGAFQREKTFNEPLNCWDVSSVTSMHAMFHYASSFNQPLDSWNTAGVRDFSHMFYIAPNFDQDLSSWQTSAVTDMTKMFAAARSFNHPIESWDVSSVSYLSNMFFAARSFDQPLNGWDTIHLKSLYGVFTLASKFNQPLDAWTTDKVVNLQYAFRNAAAFNQPLHTWNTSSVVSMTSAFFGASKFNQPLDGDGLPNGGWDLSSVTNTKRMFASAPAFDQCLGTWSGRVRNQLNETEDPTQAMFHRSGCPNHANATDSGTPARYGPWCQGEAQGCSAPPPLEALSPGEFARSSAGGGGVALTRKAGGSEKSSKSGKKDKSDKSSKKSK